MSIAELVRKMATAGASPDVIALAVEAVEAEQSKLAEARAKRALQKAKERERRATVARQGRDSLPTVGDPLPPKESSPTPPQRNNPSPRPPDGETRGARDRRVEAECRKIGAELPVITDPNFASVMILLDNDPALSEADVFQAMRAVANTRHRLRFWGKLEPWIRKAARDRLADAMGPENYARAGPAVHAQPAPRDESRSVHAAVRKLRDKFNHDPDAELFPRDGDGLRRDPVRLLSQGRSR